VVPKLVQVPKHLTKTNLTLPNLTFYLKKYCGTLKLG
jgi:hypothetical protein